MNDAEKHFRRLMLSINGIRRCFDPRKSAKANIIEHMVEIDKMAAYVVHSPDNPEQVALSEQEAEFQLVCGLLALINDPDVTKAYFNASPTPFPGEAK